MKHILHEIAYLCVALWAVSFLSQCSTASASKYSSDDIINEVLSEHLIDSNFTYNNHIIHPEIIALFANTWADGGEAQVSAVDLDHSIDSNRFSNEDIQHRANGTIGMDLPEGGYIEYSVCGKMRGVWVIELAVNQGGTFTDRQLLFLGARPSVAWLNDKRYTRNELVHLASFELSETWRGAEIYVHPEQTTIASMNHQMHFIQRENMLLLINGIW